MTIQQNPIEKCIILRAWLSRNENRSTNNWPERVDKMFPFVTGGGEQKKFPPSSQREFDKDLGRNWRINWQIINGPETWEKHKVRDAMAKPAAKAMANGGGVCPAQGMAAPQMMKIRKKVAKHSATMERQKSRDRISACIGTRIAFGWSIRSVSKRSSNVCSKPSTLAVVNGADTLMVVISSLVTISDFLADTQTSLVSPTCECYSEYRHLNCTREMSRGPCSSVFGPDKTAVCRKSSRT